MRYLRLGDKVRAWMEHAARLQLALERQGQGRPDEQRRLEDAMGELLVSHIRGEDLVEVVHLAACVVRAAAPFSDLLLTDVTFWALLGPEGTRDDPPTLDELRRKNPLQVFERLADETGERRCASDVAR